MSVHCSSIHINHTLQEKENWFSWRGEPFVLCLVGALAPVGPRSDPSNSLVPWNAPHTWERHGRGTDQPPCSAGNCLTYLKANVWFSNTEKWVANTRTSHWRAAFRGTCRCYACMGAICRWLKWQVRKETAWLHPIYSSRSSGRFIHPVPTTLEKNLWVLRP